MHVISKSDEFASIGRETGAAPRAALRFHTIPDSTRSHINPLELKAQFRMETPSLSLANSRTIEIRTSTDEFKNVLAHDREMRRFRRTSLQFSR